MGPYGCFHLAFCLSYHRDLLLGLRDCILIYEKLLVVQEVIRVMSPTTVVARVVTLASMTMNRLSVLLVR
jgi:hypothetical protein